MKGNIEYNKIDEAEGNMEYHMSDNNMKNNPIYDGVKVVTTPQEPMTEVIDVGNSDTPKTITEIKNFPKHTQYNLRQYMVQGSTRSPTTITSGVSS